jgi:hypothetical protein
VLKVRKGDTMGEFLRKVRDQLAGDFREMRGASVDQMLYIKEDLIIPHDFTFNWFILNKARGKSGPVRCLLSPLSFFFPLSLSSHTHAHVDTKRFCSSLVFDTVTPALYQLGKTSCVD